MLGQHLDIQLIIIHSFGSVNLELWTDFKWMTIFGRRECTGMILAIYYLKPGFLKEKRKVGKAKKGSAFSSDSLLWQIDTQQLKMSIVEPECITANETCKLWAKLSLISSNIRKLKRL